MLSPNTLDIYSMSPKKDSAYQFTWYKDHPQKMENYNHRLMVIITEMYK